MPRVSVFIFEIDTKKNNLEKEIIDSFKKIRVDISKGLPWEGFLTKKGSETLASEKDNLGAERFIYAIEEEITHTSIDGTEYINRKNIPFLYG
jgi:hypothetical protein